MKKRVYDKAGMTLLRTEEAEPECGDYCDACGDCIRCNAETPCYYTDDGSHVWVEYEEETCTKTPEVSTPQPKPKP